MEPSALILTVVLLSTGMYYAGRSRALALVGGPRHLSSLHSLPSYYGHYVAMWSLLPALALIVVWLLIEPRVLIATVVATLPDIDPEATPDQLKLLAGTIQNLAVSAQQPESVTPAMRAAVEYYREVDVLSHQLLAACTLSIALLAAVLAWRRIAPGFMARNRVESALTGLLVGASSVAILTTIGIVLSVLFEAIRFFREVSVAEFLFGIDWSPQTALRSDQFGSSGSFGALPLFAGTLLITFIAMLVAVPVGLMTAIYLAEYASSRVRSVAKPALEILAGIPTVVYGFFAALTVAPVIRRLGESVGLEVASESALAAGLVMGIMILPLVSSLADDAINAVPDALRDGALALGSTRSEMLRSVVIPAAAPGIIGGLLLAVSRAIGETMIVVMAAGLAANLTANPFEAVTTVTVQIVRLLVGDQEFDSAKTLAAFALGLVLFVVTLLLNVAGLRVMRRYQTRYE